MNNFLDMFTYPFTIRALLVGVMLSFIAALIGAPLVLRKNSMIGDGLSHAAFGAFTVALVLGLAPMAFAIPVTILAAFVILTLSKSRRFHGDAAIAVLSAASLALGVIVISMSGVNIDLSSYLFGSILSVSWPEVWLTIIVTIIVAILYLFAYHRIFAITFDDEFAAATGVNTARYDVIFSIICSVVIVLGLRLLGTLLISSLIIFPALSAMQLAKSFKSTIVVSVIISVLAFLLGLILSYLLSAPTGATVVLVNLAILILAVIYRRLR